MVTSPPMNEHAFPSDREWVEIGRRCSSGRRSVWARVHPRPEAVQVDEWFIAHPENVVCVELCAGREGGDAYVRLDASNPAFAALLDVVLTAMYATET